jgi:hypothetical protein
MVANTRYVAIFVASLVMGAALPVAASSSMSALTPQGTYTTRDGVTVQLHRAYSFKDRYDFNRAVVIYNLYIQKGLTGLVVPDINKRDTIDFYLKNPVEDHVELEEVRTTPLSTNDYQPKVQDISAEDAISDAERAALQRAEKIGVCFRYPGFSTAYYVLCQKFIQGKKAANTVGHGNDIATARAVARSSLRGDPKTKPKTIFEGLKDNRSGPRVSGYGKKGGRSAGSSSSSSK